MVANYHATILKYLGHNSDIFDVNIWI